MLSGLLAPSAARRWLAIISLFWGVAVTAEAGDAVRTIVCFGDSLTAGYGLDNPMAEGYPALLQAKVDGAHLPWRVVNAGLSGETTAGGLRRIDWVLRQPIDIFILALGGNDGLRGIDPATSEQNLNAIVARVREKYPDARIVIAGMEMPTAMGENFTRQYREVFPAVAKKHAATLIPFLLEGVAGHPDLNQSDGIHPTAAGQKVVTENVWKVLRPLL